ncbi:hypothetical protein EV361DRAFT_1036946 [Lentinula raphanica]|nr:hypothetical protein EV361DRAFT_1036946 [Lentinula raphanica]
MFRNYRNNTFIKRNQHDIIQAAIAKLRKVSTNQELDASKAAEALVCFKSPGGAKQIFRVENEEKIHEEMARMRAEAAQAREAEGRNLEDFDPRKEDNGGAFYQRALTALWKAADQDAYEKKAKGHDLFKNQEKFPSVIKTALEALCENGALGPMEILFMSGFRNEHNELVLTRLSCHSGSIENPTQPGFLRSPGEELLSATLTRYWCEYCEAHIPRHAIPEEFDRDVESAYISTNSSGIPVLLEFNLYDLKPMEIGKILRKFLNVLWFWSWPQDQERPSIPLLEIFTHPDDYYDTKQYTFPVALAEIETLHPRDLWTLAEFLVSISGASCPNPFVFRKKSDIRQRISSRRRYEELVQSTGEEIVPCTNNTPGLPITGSPLLLPTPIATNDATTNESSVGPESSPTITDSVDDSPAPLSLNPTPVVSSTAMTAKTPVSASLPIAPVSRPLVSASSPVAPAATAITTPVDPMTATPLVSASSPVAPVAPIITTSIDPMTATPLVSASSPVTPVIATPGVAVATPLAMVSDSTAPGPTPLVSASSAIAPPVASAIMSETSEPQPTRQSRRGAQNKKASGAAAGSLNSAQTGTDEPRRSSRKRSAKHVNPLTDSIQQPTAKRPRQKKAIKWAHAIPQPNGQLAMVNSDGTIRGYIQEDSDGKEIVVDSNDPMLITS